MKLIVSESLTGLPVINSNDVKPLQGNLKDLSKTNYKKLKASLESKGFIVPIFVWMDSDGNAFSLDGHQRLRVIQKEIPKGVGLPYVPIAAENINDAKEKLLLIDSKYGEVTKEGFDEFTADLLDFEAFTQEFTTYDNFLDESWIGALGMGTQAATQQAGNTNTPNLNTVSIAECCDNIEFMKRYPDGFFELAIVDPNYGLGIAKKPVRGALNPKNWDKDIPSKEYFAELFRVSKNQIIWGGNYFIEYLNNTQCFIFWYKHQPSGTNFAAGEMAWTSFQRPALFFDYEYYGNHENGAVRKEKSIHPTQKPVELYEFCLSKFASVGDKILDTNLGSGSSRIASYKMGFDFYSCDNDAEIMADQNVRFNNFLEGHEKKESESKTTD